MKDVDVSVAGLTLNCQIRFADTAKYFPEPDPAALPCVGAGSVCVSEADWEYYAKTSILQNAYSEYNLLCFSVSDALLLYNRMLIHGVALRWRDHAYLICAGSGVGKSTQARNLQELCPGEFGIICGDRPALEFCYSSRSHSNSRSPAAEKEAILVHPSPWNGKENWHGAKSAPLAGVILLERGAENGISSISPWDAAISMFYSIIQTTADADNIRRVADLESYMLNTVPVWKLITHDVPASTQLLINAVFRQER